MASTDKQKMLLKLVAEAIVQTVRETGSQGAPAGHLYAGLMAHGFSLENFEQIMAVLEQTKMVRKSGQLYFAPEAK